MALASAPFPATSPFRGLKLVSRSRSIFYVALVAALHPALAVSAAADSPPPALWSLRPVVDPPVPAVKDGAWPRNAIDRFILAKLEDHAMTPAPDADRAALLRRVTFDLT